LFAQSLLWKICSPVLLLSHIAETSLFWIFFVISLWKSFGLVFAYKEWILNLMIILVVQTQGSFFSSHSGKLIDTTSFLRGALFLHRVRVKFL